MENKKETKKKLSKVSKVPIKKSISEKMDALVTEMQGIINNDRKSLNTSSCANINKAIADLSRISKNLKR